MTGMGSCVGFDFCHATGQSGPGRFIVGVSLSHTIRHTHTHTTR